MPGLPREVFGSQRVGSDQTGPGMSAQQRLRRALGLAATPSTQKRSGWTIANPCIRLTRLSHQVWLSALYAQTRRVSQVVGEHVSARRVATGCAHRSSFGVIPNSYENAGLRDLPPNAADCVSNLSGVSIKI